LINISYGKEDLVEQQSFKNTFETAAVADILGINFELYIESVLLVLLGACIIIKDMYILSSLLNYP
jgi:hypothetical protein